MSVRESEGEPVLAWRWSLLTIFAEIVKFDKSFSIMFFIQDEIRSPPSLLEIKVSLLGKMRPPDHARSLFLQPDRRGLLYKCRLDELI